MSEDVDEVGWAIEPGDDMAPMIEVVGGVIKFHREAAGMSVADFGAAMRYGEDLIRKVERGARIPRVEFLYSADELVNARGAIVAMRKYVEDAQYPKKVRDLKELEGRAVELLLYGNHNIHGLLQTPEYAKALFETRQPPLSSGEVEREVAARMARKTVFDREPTPSFSFIQEQVTLERPIGGKMVLRRQLEHLLEVSELRNVMIQVMPTDREDHASMQGLIQVLKFADGSAVGRCEGAFNARPISSPRDLRVLELRYGMIRAQALPPGESLAFIERALGAL
ncbi:Scr1 family TA system antitoxin-like transcriptional regulator [Streptomyces sp. SID12488]|uniref:helix-turn-helix domain-containing protein n=1 Tax=Streptomyces sp. SID12488 TaxID=2706040 RepID=UPI0013DC69CC|nr:Scr1 family TA system antitoxin-like transcriptional regulator [Streptomyces sp. SID12488]NEA64281.1 helix-turn-helix domain-containing protein [Streptomyces sp. SID12488]